LEVALPLFSPLFRMEDATDLVSESLHSWLDSDGELFLSLLSISKLRGVEGELLGLAKESGPTDTFSVGVPSLKVSGLEHVR